MPVCGSGSPHRCPSPGRRSSAVPSGNAIQLPDAQEKRPPRSLAGVLATGFGLGFAPFAPGTFGSALGVALALPLLGAPFPAYALVAAAIAGLAIWAAGVTQRATGRHDDGRIVIDEVAGQIVALAPLSLAGALPPLAWVALVVTGFVTFRLFDVWKPGPVGWAERSLPGGAGVVADDLLAGALAALVLAGGMWLLGEIGWIVAPFGSAASEGVQIG